MVSVKQVREKRKEVNTLRLAYDAANQAHKEAEAAAFAASTNLRIAKDDFLRGRDALEELGREFALDEGENDYTPPMTFEPPLVQGLQGKILTFPQGVIVDPSAIVIAEIEIEGNLSVGPAGTPVPSASCTCDGLLHAPMCPLCPAPKKKQMKHVDPESFGPGMDDIPF